MTTDQFKEGYVVLPLDTYNKMLTEVAKAKSAFKLNKSWGGDMELRVDVDFAYDVATELLAAHRDRDKYTVRNIDEFYQMSVNFARFNGDDLPLEG